MNRHTIMRTFAIVVIALLILNYMIPVAECANTEQGASRSGKVVVVDEEVSILPKQVDGFNYTSLMNIANSTEEWMNNYNQTIAPFMNDNPTVKGIMVYPYFTPIVVASNFTNRDISVGGYIQLDSQTLIDGVSQFWMRLPVLNLSEDVVIRTRVIRVLDPVNFNATMTSIGSTTFTTDQLQTIYDFTYDSNAVSTGLTDSDPRPNGYDGLVIQHETEYGGNVWWNTTWVQINACMFPNENYYIQHDLVFPAGQKNGELQLAISQEDFCADNRYNAWMYVNGEDDYQQFDLDMSMILTYGVSSGITGLGIGDAQSSVGVGVAYLHMNASIPIKHVIDKTYFETVIPFLFDVNESPSGEAYLTVTITAYSSEDDSVLIGTTSFIKILNKTYDFIVHDWTVSGYSGQYLDHIRFDVRARGDQYGSGPYVKLWAYQLPELSYLNGTGFTDIYVQDYHVETGNSYSIISTDFTVPYGYFGLSSSYWNATSMNLVVIPINTPDTPLEIVEAVHRFEFYLEDENGRQDFSVENLLEMLAKCIEYVVKAFIDTVVWFFSDVLGGIIDFIFGEGTADWLWNTLIGILQWVWDMIRLMIDAFEWFAYWTVRTIYSLSVVIIYLINVFGVISINSALLAYAKTGNSRDFVKAFRSGWNMVWGIISLLISALILAIGIIGAVVPL